MSKKSRQKRIRRWMSPTHTALNASGESFFRGWEKETKRYIAKHPELRLHLNKLIRMPADL